LLSLRARMEVKKGKSLCNYNKFNSYSLTERRFENKT